MDRKTKIKAFALQNAIRYNGKANEGAILGRLIAELKVERSDIPSFKKEVHDIVAAVNNLSVEEQGTRLKKLAPKMLEKKKQEHDLFGFLHIKKGEKVITAFPPEPSKYPHIGHAKSILVNYELAKQHKGKFILRFEDTNPELVKKEFYDIHLENYAWLGVKPDKISYASDFMDTFNEKIIHLLKEGHAYVTKASQDEIKTMRQKGIAVAERNESPEAQLARVEEMKTAEPGSMVILAKIDLKHKNSTMRDPALMRIIDHDHPRLGKKYRLWPTYDLENAVMDGVQKITHRLRSKEFEMRNELQRYLQRLLGLPETKIYEFARFNLKGVESSGRLIREKIEKGEFTGWDDPRLTTLVALRRRGFQAKAIKDFALSTGLSKAEATLTWDDLIKHNKRLLDEEADRYFFIADPIPIQIEGVESKTVLLPVHPRLKKGERKFTVTPLFFLDKNDIGAMNDHALYRLMECCNFSKEGGNFQSLPGGIEEYRIGGRGIFHWLPQEECVDATIMMPDCSEITGKAELTIKKVKEGQVIQFERFGFCRRDDPKALSFRYTHK
ncbi:MAG: glutamate--tRNA ligase [Nanoarchaeota archaeon]